jgi:biopolymer transport protein ExbB/TolQ
MCGYRQNLPFGYVSGRSSFPVDVSRAAFFRPCPGCLCRGICFEIEDNKEFIVMDIGALLKAFIFLISSSLLYPVLFLLVVLTFLIIIYAGSFFAEWLERVRLKSYVPQKLPEILKTGSGNDVLSHRVNRYVKTLKETLQSPGKNELAIENLLQETSLAIWKSMDRLRILVRVAPSVGLIGTLIPMGTGLAALGQGDMTKLTTDLVIAFTTTVVGLAIGTTAFFFYTVRRRWIEEDIKNMELATEILVSQSEEKNSCGTFRNAESEKRDAVSAIRPSEMMIP